MSVHMIEAKFLLLEVCTTTMTQYLTHEVSTHPWGQFSTARGQYYYTELNYLTHEVSKHQWGQVSSGRGQYYYFKSKYLRPRFYCKRLILLHWVPVSDTWSQFTSLRQSFYCWRSVLLPWVPVADTLMSVHIPKAKYLLLEFSTTTLSPRFWHM